MVCLSRTHEGAGGMVDAAMVTTHSRAGLETGDANNTHWQSIRATRQHRIRKSTRTVYVARFRIRHSLYRAVVELGQR
jgi:hypothetical protein